MIFSNNIQRMIKGWRFIIKWPGIHITLTRTQLSKTSSKSTIKKHQKKVWNRFKINNKVIRTTSSSFNFNSRVSICDFEQVIVCWEENQAVKQVGTYIYTAYFNYYVLLRHIDRYLKKRRFEKNCSCDQACQFSVS